MKPSMLIHAAYNLGDPLELDSVPLGSLPSVSALLPGADRPVPGVDFFAGKLGRLDWHRR